MHVADESAPPTLFVCACVCVCDFCVKLLLLSEGDAIRRVEDGPLDLSSSYEEQLLVTFLFIFWYPSASPDSTVILFIMSATGVKT